MYTRAIAVCTEAEGKRAVRRWAVAGEESRRSTGMATRAVDGAETGGGAERVETVPGQYSALLTEIGHTELPRSCKRGRHNSGANARAMLSSTGRGSGADNRRTYMPIGICKDAGGSKDPAAFRLAKAQQGAALL